MTSPLPVALLRAFLLLAGGAFLLWLLAPALANWLLHFPDRSHPGPPPILGGIQGEEVHYAAPDGTRLLGWWFEAEAPADGPPPPAVLFFHGNAGHLGDRAFQAQGMLREGVSLFLAAYRGYGGSEGRPSPAGHLEDAEGALDALLDRVEGPEQVVIHGRSLGGAVAAGLARKRPQVAGLVLESTFTDLPAMARAAYPFLPGPLLGRLSGLHDTRGALEGWEGPVLVIHGTRDTLVPFRMGVELHQAAEARGGARAPDTPPGARLLPVEEAGHNDLVGVAGPAYFREVADFVRAVTRR